MPSIPPFATAAAQRKITPPMKLPSLLSAAFFSAILLHAADNEPPPGFVPLFNGKDLTGWVPVNVAPDTFTVRDGMVVISGVPTGYMRTARMYENFVLECDLAAHERRREQRRLHLGRRRPGDGHRLHSRHRGAGARQRL
jgi:hypothetical protein